MNWVDRFFDFFRQIEPSLGIGLNANNCREGWLHGEFFRHFITADNGFLVNCRYYDDGPEHDLYCGLPTEMIAEVKVYGQRGYSNKNFCGAHDLTRLLPPTPGARVPVTFEEIEQTLSGTKDAEKKNSYFRDVERLLAVHSSVKRYLILVLQKADEADDFGRSISAVQGAPQEHDLELDAFRVRVSQF